MTSPPGYSGAIDDQHRGVETDPLQALAMLELIAPDEYGCKTTTTVRVEPTQSIAYRDLYLSLLDKELARRGEPLSALPEHETGR